MQELTMAEKDRLIIELPKVKKFSNFSFIRYCRNLFDRDYKATIGVDFEVERFKILDQEFNMQIWDTAGQERFKCMAGAYYRAAHAIILVFELTNIKSLQHTNKIQGQCDANEDQGQSRGIQAPTYSSWREAKMILKVCPSFFSFKQKDNDFSQMEIHAFELANEMNAEYWSVSSKTGENVKEFFRRVAAITFEQAILGELESRGTRLTSPQIGTGGGL
ncbi:Ras-related protein Rab-34, partial [Acropora cervicornis]